MPKLHPVKQGELGLVTVTMDNGKKLMDGGKPAVFKRPEARRVACDPEATEAWLKMKGHSLGKPMGKTNGGT